MATITKPGFVAAIALEPTLSRVTAQEPAPTTEPRGRTLRRRGRSAGPATARERNPRNAFDLDHGQGDSNFADGQSAEQHDEHPTDAVRDFAMTEVALSQRGISQNPTAGTAMTGGDGQLSTTNMTLAVGADNDHLMPTGAVLSRDRMLVTANLGNQTDASGGMLAGLPTVIVNHHIDAHTSVGGLFATDGKNHIPGVTFSQSVGNATLAGALVVFGKAQSKARIVEVDNEQQRARVQYALSHVAGVIGSVGAAFHLVGPVSRFGLTLSRDITLTRWEDFSRAQAEQRKSNLFANTVMAMRSPKSYFARTTGTALGSGEDTLKIGESIAFTRLSSLVMGGGAAIFGLFAGAGFAITGEQAVRITREGSHTYAVDVQSRLATMGNVSVELPVIAALYATYGKGASVTDRLRLDTRQAAATNLLQDIFEGERLPFEVKQDNWFLRRIPGGQAYALNEQRIEAFLRDPKSLIEMFVSRSPLRGVTYEHMEVTRLMPGYSIGATISGFSYILLNKLGSFERVVDRDRRISVAVTPKESRHRRELIFRSRKNVPGIKQESVEAKLADETMYRVLSNRPGELQQNEPSWLIEATINLSSHGAKELKRSFGWLAEKLLQSDDTPVTQTLDQVGRKRSKARLAVGFKQRLQLSDVLEIIDISTHGDAQAYRASVASIRSQELAPQRQHELLLRLAKNFMETQIAPRLHKEGVQVVTALHQLTSQPAQIIFEDDQLQKAQHTMDKLAVTQSTPMLDKSRAEVEQTVKWANDIVKRIRGVQLRVNSLDRRAFVHHDTQALTQVNERAEGILQGVYDAVRVEPQDPLTTQDVAVEQVARRLRAPQAAVLKRLQTPPPSRRPSLSPLNVLGGSATPSSASPTTSAVGPSATDGEVEASRQA